MKTKFRILIVLFFTILLSLLGISIARIYLIDKTYGYDVKKDYTYDIPLHARSKKIQVSIKNNSFEWPSAPPQCDTGFLRVKINSAILGFVFEPHIEIETDGYNESQFFERGCAGDRYLNISKLCSLANVAGKKILLRARHLTLDPIDSDLVLFRNDGNNAGPIVVVAPHPDDAEIASFAYYKDNARTAYIVTVTAGEGGKYEDDIVGRLDLETMRNLKGRLRIWDSIAVPIWGGVSPTRSYNLGYFDGTIGKMYDNPESPVINKFLQTSDVNIFRRYNVASLPMQHSREAKWRNLVDDFEQLFKEIRPRIIVTPHPDLDANQDHIYSSIAVIDALRNLKMKDGFLFLYTNHGVYSDYYPYGPSGSLVSLPPSFDNSIHMHSIYSHPLTVPEQREKLFALEGFHDLRAAPQVTDYGPWWLVKRSLVNFYKFFFYYLVGNDHSYYRRAIRANELFFVVKFDETDRLMKMVDAGHGKQDSSRGTGKK